MEVPVQKKSSPLIIVSVWATNSTASRCWGSPKKIVSDGTHITICSHSVCTSAGLLSSALLIIKRFIQSTLLHRITPNVCITVRLCNPVRFYVPPVHLSHYSRCFLLSFYNLPQLRPSPSIMRMHGITCTPYQSGIIFILFDCIDRACESCSICRNKKMYCASALCVTYCRGLCCLLAVSSALIRPIPFAH